jgi:hypothetical protein
MLASLGQTTTGPSQPQQQTQGCLQVRLPVLSHVASQLTPIWNKYRKILD